MKIWDAKISGEPTMKEIKAEELKEN